VGKWAESPQTLIYQRFPRGHFSKKSGQKPKKSGQKTFFKIFKISKIGFGQIKVGKPILKVGRKPIKKSLCLAN
jgi:hypothetical protein